MYSIIKIKILDTCRIATVNTVLIMLAKTIQNFLKRICVSFLPLPSSGILLEPSIVLSVRSDYNLPPLSPLIPLHTDTETSEKTCSLPALSSVFSHCNKIAKTQDAYKEKSFILVSFRMFKSEAGWIHCFGTWQQIRMGTCDRVKPLTLWPGSKGSTHGPTVPLNDMTQRSKNLSQGCLS